LITSSKINCIIRVMEKNTNTKVPSNEDEIDLRKLFDAIWDGKWIIVASTTILSIIATAMEFLSFVGI